MPRREKRKIFDFDPKSLSDYDFRFNAAKRIRKVYLDLKRQCDIKSTAKDLLARRAAFLSVKIATLEVESLTGGKVKESALLQAINGLVGILKQLGLEDLSATTPTRLKDYISLPHKERLKAQAKARKRQRLARKHNRSRPHTLAIAE
jgi:hypothetical protein